MKRFGQRTGKFTLLTSALQLILILVVSVAVAVAAPEGKKKVATVDIPVKAELYATDPQPLTITQCGQCHPSYFSNLKNNGGKHRFDCRDCHQAFHTYNPSKGGWDALMPKCGSCHNLPHGAAVKDCASCHNPHFPKKVTMSQRLTGACGDCHAGAKEQLVKFPSKHSKVSCQTCHTSHGFKPQCFACHKPHHQGQEIATCTKCHDVHKPLLVTYEKNSPAVTCGSCHGKIYEKWQKTPSKHAKVNCATCHHTKHKNIPKCIECHPAPHKKAILDKFPKCLGCHLDVHDLPVQQKK
jgi:hypothetical protein